MRKVAGTASAVNKSVVYKCHQRFRNGRSCIEDDHRSGQEATVKTSMLVERSFGYHLGISTTEVRKWRGNAGCLFREC